MKRITYLLIAVAAAATLLLEVAAASRPVSSVGLGFIAWGASPYLYLAGLNRWVTTSAAIKAMLILTALTGQIGIWLVVDAMFLNPDAQSGLVFLFAPLWQWFLLLLATVPLYVSNRGVARRDV